MRITSIVENTSHTGLSVEHGLSLYIERKDGQVILFDMGQTSLFAQNAEQLGLSIPAVDTAIISHGHYDHGGGLRTFLSLNDKARIYLHHEAFLPHFPLRQTGLRYIGLDRSLLPNERFILCSGQTDIDSHMQLFANVTGNCCLPGGNRMLYGPTEDTPDLFSHEQNLLIREDNHLILFAGCAHCGIINILRHVVSLTGQPPSLVFAGMHLAKSGLDKAAEKQFINLLAHELQQYPDTRFYTMHCTGTDEYNQLKQIMGDQIEYFACGSSILISNS